MNTFALWFIKFYQKFLTVFSYGSCRYYPTCSEYAKSQMMHNSFFKGLGASLLRILRCNQLFPGGIEYPIVKKDFRKRSNVFCERRQSMYIHYWFVPKNSNLFYVVKTFYSQ